MKISRALLIIPATAKRTAETRTIAARAARKGRKRAGSSRERSQATAARYSSKSTVEIKAKMM